MLNLTPLEPSPLTPLLTIPSKRIIFHSVKAKALWIIVRSAFFYRRAGDMKMSAEMTAGSQAGREAR